MGFLLKKFSWKKPSKCNLSILIGQKEAPSKKDIFKKQTKNIYKYMYQKTPYSTAGESGNQNVTWSYTNLILQYFWCFISCSKVMKERILGNRNST